MKYLTFTTIIAVLLLTSFPITAIAQPLGAAPTVRHQSQCEVSAAPNQVDAYQAVLDFAPNQWTAMHTHAGPVCVSQLAGDATFRYEAGEVKVVAAGSAYLEDSARNHAAGNLTTTNARMLVTNLTPRGLGQATSGPANPNPVVRTFNAKNEINALPAQLTIVHLVLDFAPGAATPLQVHGGWALHTMLSGELNVRQNGADKNVKAGDSWSESPGQAYAIVNLGSAAASVYESVLLPKGAALTTDQPAAPLPLPVTGGGLDASPFWLPLLGLALLALAGGRIASVRRRR